MADNARPRRTPTGSGPLRSELSSPAIGIRLDDRFASSRDYGSRPAWTGCWKLSLLLPKDDSHTPFPRWPRSLTRTQSHRRLTCWLVALHRQLRCIRKAEASFRRALVLKPQLIDAHKELIYILGIQSRRREVDAEFLQLAKLTQLTHHDLFTWALTHFTRWNPDIVADLDGFIKADPEDRYSRLAVVELLLERPEVESYITRILEPLPNSDPDALALRINLASNLGRIEEVERLLASAPMNHPRLSRIRGEIALRRHDLDTAIKQFQQALSAEPYDRVSPMQLAQALQLKGDKAAADAYLERVKRLNRLYNLVIRVRSPKQGNRTADLAELGEACEQAGLREEAKCWYTLAITADPLDSGAQQALYRLRDLAGSTVRYSSTTP